MAWWWQKAIIAEVILEVITISRVTQIINASQRRKNSPNSLFLLKALRHLEVMFLNTRTCHSYHTGHTLNTRRGFMEGIWTVVLPAPSSRLTDFAGCLFGILLPRVQRHHLPGILAPDSSTALRSSPILPGPCVGSALIAAWLCTQREQNRCCWYVLVRLEASPKAPQRSHVLHLDATLKIPSSHCNINVFSLLKS